MAHWIITDKGFGGMFYKCSECGEVYCDIFRDVDDYCPNCNASIDTDDNEYK